MRIFITTLLLLSASLFAQEEIKKKDWRFSVHLEDSGKNKFTFPVPLHGKNIPFSKSPIFTHKDIDRARVFKAADGSYGAVFRMEKHVAQRLYSTSSFSKGKRLVSMVMGRPVDIIEIDWAKQDRLFVVWKGMNYKEAEYIKEEIWTLKIEKKED